MSLNELWVKYQNKIYILAVATKALQYITGLWIYYIGKTISLRSIRDFDKIDLNSSVIQKQSFMLVQISRSIN